MSDSESGDTRRQRPRFSRGSIMMIALWGCWAITLSGCFTLAAATSPYQRHLDYIQVGENRDKILQEVGQPDSSTLEEGKRVDIFESDPQGPEPGKRMTEVGKGLAADLIVSVCTVGIYPVFIEWGVAPAITLSERAVKGGAPYDAWTVVYGTDDKVESVQKEVWHSRIWPANSASVATKT
jgi:hypothetical protein